MGRTIVFQGQELVIPGAYSFLDVSRLLTPTSGGVGIVALVGESDGGKPGLHLFPGGSSPALVKSELKSGPGANSCRLALRSGVDPLVQGGASTVLFYKTNNSTPSTAAIGGLITGVAEETEITVVADSAGSLNGTYFILQDTAGSVAFWFDHGNAGTPEPVHGADRSVEITTVANDDTASAVALKVSAAIAGDAQFTSPTPTGALVTAVDVALGARPAASAGTSGFTVSESVAGVDADVTATVVATSKQYGAFTAQYKASISTTTGRIVVTVFDENGEFEKTPALGGTAYMTLAYSGLGTATAKLSYIGSVLTFEYLVDASPVATIDCTGKTLGQLAQALSPYSDLAVTVPGEFTQFAVADLDLKLSAATIGTGLEFKASIKELIEWGDNQSTLVKFTRGPLNEAATLIGENQSAISFSGGTRGTSSNSSVQAAYDALLDFRVNITVPLFSSDNQDGSTITVSSVNAIVKDHVISRSSILGRSECQAYVSVAGDKAAFIEMCQAMNSRWIAVVSQKPTELDIDGTLVEQPEYAFATICAQTQAGSPVGTPLTNRVIASSGLSQHVSWKPSVDGPELIRAGALIGGADENNVLRIINGYTSWVGDSNNANIFIETVESLAVFAFEHRKFMSERFVGVSRYNLQDILNAISESVNAAINNTQSIRGWDPEETRVYEYTGGQIRYDVAVVPWEGVVFVLPTIIAIREAA